MRTKLLLVVVSLALSLGLIGNAGAALLLHYQFNEGTSTVIHDTVPGNANAEVLHNIAAVQWVPGYTGQAGDWAIDYDTGNVGYEWTQGNKAALAAITDKMTVVLWMKGNDRLPTATNKSNELFSMGSGFVQTMVPHVGAWAYWACGTNAEAVLVPLSAYSLGALPGDSNVTEYKNKWNLWAFTKNTTTGVMKVYCNAVLLGSATGKTAAFPDLANTPLYIGTGYDVSPNRNFAGAIDEFRVYDEELGAGDLRIIMGVSPLLAKDEDPADGSSLRTPGRTWNLTWVAGQGAVSHNVYFGDNEADVTSGMPATFKGNQTATSYSATNLEIKTYFWRIDEVQSNGTVSTGAVWRFTTLCTTENAPDGDINGDCRTDFKDFAIMAGAWLSDQV